MHVGHVVLRFMIANVLTVTVVILSHVLTVLTRAVVAIMVYGTVTAFAIPNVHVGHVVLSVVIANVLTVTVVTLSHVLTVTVVTLGHVLTVLTRAVVAIIVYGISLGSVVARVFYHV